MVIGVERGGNAAALAVLLLEGGHADPAKAVGKANESLAEYQRIGEWFVWPEADFPRTSTLKPLLPRIRQVVANQAKSNPVSPGDTGEIAAMIRQITGRTSGGSNSATSLEADLGLSSLDRVELMGASSRSAIRLT